MITKRDFIFRGSYFFEEYNALEHVKNAVIFIIHCTIYIYTISNIQDTHISVSRCTLLTKITVARKEVALSYHRVRGLYFLAVIFAETININRIWKKNTIADYNRSQKKEKNGCILNVLPAKVDKNARRIS